MHFDYQMQKFDEAQQALMLPHPNGEAASIASAFGSITYGLDHLDREAVSESAREWLTKLDRFMDTTGLEDPAGVGLFHVKAESFSTDDKFEISRLVHELASYFSGVFWSNSNAK